MLLLTSTSALLHASTPAETKLTTGLALKANDPKYSLTVGSQGGKVSRGSSVGSRAAARSAARGCAGTRLASAPTCTPALPSTCTRSQNLASLRLQTTISGVYPGNTAQILDTFEVCGSRVYVIDKVGGLKEGPASGRGCCGPGDGLRGTSVARFRACLSDPPLLHPSTHPQVLVPAESLDAIPAVQGGLDFSAADAAKATPKPAAAAPSPAPAPAAPAPEPAKPSAGAAAAPAAGGATRVSGVALGSGYLAGCTVQLLDKAGTPLKVTATDGEGRFSFDCGADCASLQVRRLWCVQWMQLGLERLALPALACTRALRAGYCARALIACAYPAPPAPAQATLNMPAGQSAACADTLTQQQPAFNVRATVADVKDGAPLALSPLSTISALAAAQQAAPAPEPSTRRLRKMLQLVGEPADVMQQFTVAEAGGGSGAQSASQVSTTEGDALAAAQQGDQAAIRLLAFNQVGGWAGSAGRAGRGRCIMRASRGAPSPIPSLTTHCDLPPPPRLRQEVICAGSVGGALLAGADASNRTAPAVGAGALLDELAANLLAGKPFNLTDAASLAGLLDSAQSRAAGAGASELKPEAAKAAAGTVALVSGLLEQVVSTAGQGELEGDRAVVVLARLAKVCQTELAPAAEQLARGQLSPAEWEQRYTLQAIGDLAKKA